MTKVIILAGGYGTRISEETNDKPKPMVPLDDKPIIWHLMNIFSNQGFSEFIIAGGYKYEVIKAWSDHENFANWKVDVLDTGLTTMTGGRIKRSMDTIEGQQAIVTYGDGLGNVPIAKLLDFHERSGLKATVTAVRPPARFGVLESENGVVTHFGEKNQVDAGWINGGFFVLEPEVIQYITNDSCVFESEVLPKLAKLGQLAAFHHQGFWKPMDTLREKNELSELAKNQNPPWLL
jgi:glucose-1-phosphate cytidylyltransferase